MAERPIIYQTSMVQAILDDRKTKTRRVNGLEEVNESPDKMHLSKESYVDAKGRLCLKFFRSLSIGSRIAVCPYGNVGDLLWVREAFLDGEDYPCWEPEEDENPRFAYRADCPTDQLKIYKWKPSIHMPKEAARIWLELTDIRVERLNDISEEDAIAEGIEPDPLGPNATDGAVMYEVQRYYNYAKEGYRYVNAYDSFKSLWQSINGEDSWSHNPWVWVISFKVLSKTGRPVRKEAAHA